MTTASPEMLGIKSASLEVIVITTALLKLIGIKTVSPELILEIPAALMLRLPTTT